MVMSNEEINIKINELVDEIKSNNFTGTDEEIKIKYILYLDKYIKNNIDYHFDCVNFGLLHPDEFNPFSYAFSIEGFFKEDEVSGKRLAVCGGISAAANIILNRLGIKSDYVYGHFVLKKDNGEIEYVGHRWNNVTIGNNIYMVDFTAGLIIHNVNKNNDYFYAAEQLLDTNDESNEYDYLFFDKLSSKERMGGLKTDLNGHSIDIVNNYKDFSTLVSNPYKIYSNLASLNKNVILEYVDMLDEKVNKSNGI